MHYRKKPVVIEAIQWNGKLDKITDLDTFIKGIDWGLDGDCITIPTLEGLMYASPGDYIIKGIQGEFYPCKPEIFNKTYEAV